MSQPYGSQSKWIAFLAACVAAAAAVILSNSPASASTSLVGSPELIGTPHASLPPGLVALEQKMEGLDLSSVRVSFHQAIGVAPLFARGGSRHLHAGSHGVVEAGFKDHVARLRYVDDGHHLMVRLVHGVLYVGDARLARIDGGRPWVAIRKHSRIAEHLNLGPKLLDGGPTFAFLREVLARAVSVTEDGAATVEGKETVHFTATFKAPGAPIGGPPPRRIPATSTLQLFVTPAGLPIETIGTINDGLTLTTTVSKLRGVDFPLVVKAPPAKLTIGERALKRIERRRERRMRECLKRMMRERHPKHFLRIFKICERVWGGGGYVPGRPKILVIKG